MNQRFVVPGMPVAWQRPQHGRTHRGNSYTYTPNKTKSFERDVAWEAKRAGIKLHEGIVAVTLMFFGCRGDADNLAKSVLDALNGIAWNDDRQVEELHIFVDRKAKPARAEILMRTKDDDAGCCSYCGSRVVEAS